jgi:ADP-heptose:LPS heptosyltransferase
MKEILLINLTRMGDLLQTTPLMAGLKKNYRGSRITLLVNSAFSEICRGIPFIDDLLVFDMKDYRNRLTNGKYTLAENYKYLEELIGQVNEREYDLTVNITHSPVSAILTSFIRTKEVRGFTIDSEGHRIIKHPWMRYFFNVIPNRNYNPFHLVDMYLKIGGVNREIDRLMYETPPGGEEGALSHLKQEGVSESDLLIGFHLGASKSDKTWPVSSYVELAAMIGREFGAKILLFGTEGERDLADKFEQITDDLPINLIGKTNLGELAAIMKRCRLFISNDTGPLHIAASAGTKVIDISAANVNFMETGPYGEGHYVIQADLPCVPCGFDVQCKDMICKEVLQPAAVFNVVKEALCESGSKFVSDSPLNRNLQVYKSYFKEDGFIDFNPLIKHPIRKETFYRILYRYVWSLDDLISDETDSGYKGILRDIAAYDDFKHAYKISRSIAEEAAVLDKLITLSEKGRHLAAQIQEEAVQEALDIKRLKGIWNEIETIDNKIELIGHTNPCFRPLTIMYGYAKESLEGNNLRVLAETSGSHYNDLTVRSLNMMFLLKRVISDMDSAAKENPLEFSCQK